MAATSEKPASTARKTTVVRHTRKHKHKYGGVLIVVIIVFAIIGIVAGAGYSGPTCQAHSQDCARTSNGIWIPFWYYRSLQQVQYGDDPSASAGDVSGPVPSTSGTQPSVSEEEAYGATPSEAQSAHSAASSDDSGDDGGGDDGGGGGGGDD